MFALADQCGKFGIIGADLYGQCALGWGGYESLVMPAAASINQAGEHNAAIDFGISPMLIRLFIGLEDPEELWADLGAAFANA